MWRPGSVWASCWPSATRRRPGRISRPPTLPSPLTCWPRWERGSPPSVWPAGGQAALAQEEPALAVLALERATVRMPDFADAHALLGRALEGLGRDEAARAHLETAVRLAPDSPLARSLLGLYYLNRGDPAAARPHLEAACDLDPQNPAFALYLGFLYADLGQYAAADIWLA
jgi:Flp pilus assembly protein TadD, contains TPR repeats